MPMIPNSLQADLVDIYDNENRSPSESANLYASAIVSLWESAIAPGAGSVTAAPVRSIIQQACADAWGLNQMSSLPTAIVIATALNSALAGVIVSGGAYGAGPCIPLGLGGLMADLTDIYSLITTNPSEAAQKEAAAIVNFSKATLCIGSGVGSPPVPQIGPLT